jgi:hypothetical protein
MKVCLVNSGLDLKKHFDNIALLFLECFSKEICYELWEWAYIKNPFGHAIVALAYDDDRLVGHYAVIPYPLSSNAKKISAYLAMTTMVSRAHVKYGLFQSLAEIVYSEIWLKDPDSIVFGFPNKNALPGLRKRLCWTLDESVMLVNMDMKSYVEYKYSRLNQSDAISADFRNPEFLRWRSSKPGALWIKNGDLYFKKFNDNFDLMIDVGRNFDKKIAPAIFNVLCKSNDLDAANLMRISLKYPFGYRTRVPNRNLNFFLQMCMSDVF